MATAYVLDATVVAAFQRIGCLSTLNALGLPLDLGEAASIALCLRSSDAVFVTSDRAGFFAAAKHLYPPRALSLYGFLRDLVASHALPFPIAQRLIDYADCGASLRPTWWAAWCRAHRVGPVTS